ncbi:MAG: gliding motility-associated protein GldE [Bacteroidales bacterium]|nr:gliding motility-associated protein GldE [Bacteroidales bacterium]
MILAVSVLLKPLSLGATIGIIVMFFLLFCSAMISGSEIAFFSLKHSQLKKIQLKKGKHSLIFKLLDTPKRLLATILISNNFVNVAIVILSTYITSELFNLVDFQIIAFVIQVILITSFILFFGEILPKIYANQNNEKFAGFMAGTLLLLIKLFYPISSLLLRSTSIIDKKISKKKSELSMKDLSEAIDITTDEKTSIEETKILKGIVKFGNIEVREIMKARTNVTAIDSEAKFDELLKLINESGFSRIPVFKENFDQVIGILYIKDLLTYLEKDNSFNWRSLLRPAFFVPENKKINDLLKEIQEKKIHLAIVVDEYGGTSGIVTLEDILEEIVGEISDEFDSIDDEKLFSKIDNNNYIFEGKIMLIDLCKILDIDDSIFDEVKGDSDTLAGLILELEGKIPAKEEKIEFGIFTFIILAADKRRIKKIKLTIN